MMDEKKIPGEEWEKDPNLIKNVLHEIAKNMCTNFKWGENYEQRDLKGEQVSSYIKENYIKTITGN